MPEDLMRYDLLAQEALRGVVRSALRKVARSGRLPGEHHFYIAFETRHPRVRISERLLKKYPREMTIVVQHQFWNLLVTDDEFEVELSFDNIPEKLVIPFNAVKGFLDPSVQFGLQFETVVAPAETESAGDSAVETAAKPVANPAAAEPGAVELEESAAEKPKVVSLDSFRKKT
jgi:uncharacterized protein